MASEEDRQQLKEWLESKKFGQFFDKLKECGVETLNDLRMLESDEEIQELAGPSGINMGVVFRRKFIKAVTSLDKTGMKKPSDGTLVTSPKETETPKSSKKPKSAPRAEQQALNDLVASIKSHTTQLRATREELTAVKREASDTRKQLEDLYNKAMGMLALRKKQLEGALNLAEKETTEKLSQRVSDLQSSAKQLLKCKQTVEQMMKTQPKGPEREQEVTTAVTNALDQCPADENEGTYTIVFETGGVNLLQIIENFGTVGVGKKSD